DAAGLRQRRLARHRAVAPTEDTGGGAARRRQRLEAEPREDARRAGVPRVRNHEGARRLVQCAEAGGLVVLACRHRFPPCPPFTALVQSGSGRSALAGYNHVWRSTACRSVTRAIWKDALAR